jgi:hypothetical protein
VKKIASQGFEKGLEKNGKTVDPKILDAWATCFADKVSTHWKSFERGWGSRGWGSAGGGQTQVHKFPTAVIWSAIDPATSTRVGGQTQVHKFPTALIWSAIDPATSTKRGWGSDTSSQVSDGSHLVRDRSGDLDDTLGRRLET